jgi:hypothetical protein
MFFSAGPGAGKLVAGRLRLATTALACETPAGEPEDLEFELLLELPHAAGTTAPNTMAMIATNRET